MKKIVSMLICIISLCGICSTSYAKVGDVKGYATYTDICTYINHYPITSYNLNGYTVVVAEDLRNYGFDVEWNQNNRSLSIRRNNATTITPYGKVYKYGSKQGQKSSPYLETDIKTYVNSAEVQSYNIGGKTVINIEDLRPYGEVVWVPEIRAVKMWIESLPMVDYQPLEDISSIETKTSSQVNVSGELKKEDIQIKLKIPTVGDKNIGMTIVYTNNSSAELRIKSTLDPIVNGNVWWRSDWKSGTDLIILPGETKKVHYYADPFFKKTVYLDNDSEGELVFTWNGESYYASFGVKGVIEFYKGNFAGPAN